MRTTYTQSLRRAFTPQILTLGLLAAVVSFGLGVKTAGDVQTIEHTDASSDIVAGDMNADATVDEQDVILILEIAQGYEAATPEQIAADPNDNGVLTVDDALRVLQTLVAR